MKLMSKYLLFSVAGLICGGLILSVSASADSITPVTFSDTLEKGKNTSVRRTVIISEEVTSAKVDLFFLFDTTGSMGELIDATKEKATEILDAASKLGDVAFGVGYYEDFPGYPYGGSKDIPYELVRDITTNSASARRAIDSLSLGYGQDWPEANLYALKTVADTTSWRENTTRIVVWFGDAVSHDGDMEERYPSRVGLSDAISALKAKGIIVQAVNVDRNCYGYYCYSLDEGGYSYRQFTGQATAVTNATAGRLFDGSDTSEIATVINDALKDAFDEYTEVSLELSQEFAGLGVVISPSRRTGNFDRSRERAFQFNITYTGLETGIYEVDLLAKVNGGSVAVASDTIEVLYRDCNGVLGGTAFTDICGQCVGGNTGKSTCTQDCNGVWGGTAYRDACGQCVGGKTGRTPCSQDCNGVWGGTAFVDKCGQCVSGNTGRTACSQDCNGSWGGVAYLDGCDRCVGGNTGRTSCVQDCNGDWGGTALMDECGVCVGGNTGMTACVQDCNGDWNGTAFSDPCGECVGGNTGMTACVQDCNGDWGGTAFLDECDECVGGNTGETECNPHFTGGVFKVGRAGVVEIDWLYDGGMYRGELGIFSLKGMEEIEPGSKEFAKEAARRALSNSKAGYVVLSDPTEGARLDGSIGSETTNWNSGEYKGVKQLPMRPKDTFATILVPSSTLQTLHNTPGTTSSHIRPLYSLVSSNPEYGMYMGQIADVDGRGRAFAYEDMNASESDLDYNDLIIQVTGASIDHVASLDDMIVFEDSEKRSRKRARRDWFDWRTETDIGRLIMAHLETEPEPVRMSVAFDGSADLFLYDSEGRVMGKEGGHIPGALFGYDPDGNAFISLPGLDEGGYRLVIRGKDEGTGLLKVTAMGDQQLMAEETTPVEVRANHTLKADISVSDKKDIQLGEVAESLAGPYDFNGDDRVDDADIRRVSARWNVCQGNEYFDAFFDLDDDGCITILDIMRVVNDR